MFGEEDISGTLLIEDDIAATLNNFATTEAVINRQMFGRVLVHVLRNPLDRILKDIQQIVSTVLLVSKDEESIVRANLVEQIPYVFMRCYELTCPLLESYLYDRLLDIVLDYLKDVEQQIRKNAYSSLMLMIEKYLIDNDRITNKICPAVLDLTNVVVIDSQHIDYHTSAVGLMARLAPIIGSEKTEEFFLDRFLEMCVDDIYYVRRVCATNFPVICQVMGPDITETRLLPTFLRLCEDIIWGVRKACAESLPMIALLCSVKSRRELLAPIVLKLMNDTSRWVTMSAFKILGQFISSFANPCITGLAYTQHGELIITNAADDDFKEICDQELIANFEHYEKIFNDSMNPEINVNNSNNNNKISNNDNSPITEMTDHKKIILNLLPSSDDNNIIEKTPSVASTSSNFNMNNNISVISSSISEQNNKLTIALNDNETNVKTTTAVGAAETTTTTSNIANNTKNDFDENSYEISPSPRARCKQFLKNTPDDLPSIIELAIVKQREKGEQDNQKKNKFVQRIIPPTPKLNKNNLTPGFQDPPETPLIENAPQFINFSSINLSGDTNQNEVISQDFDKENNLSENDSNQNELLTTTATTTITKSTTTTNKNDKINNVIEYKNNSKKIKYSDVVKMDLDGAIATDNDINSNDVNLQSQIVEEIKEEIILPKITDDDDINQYNSHQYWYICPDLPLDIEIVDAGRQSNTKDNKRELLEFFFNHDVITKELSNNSDNQTSPSYRNQTAAFNDHSYAEKNNTETLPQYTQDIVPPKLIEYFVAMIHYPDTDMNYFCAYNFPAVVLTLGKDNWHLMYDVLHSLCGDIQWRVRKSIAASICRIAQIIGRELATRDLVPIFLGFFKDLDEVKIEALRNLTDFLKVVDRSQHDEIIANLKDLKETDNAANWRFREDLAKQVLLLIKIYKHDDSNNICYLTHIILKLLVDKVSNVRNIACEAMVERFRDCESLEQIKILLTHFIDDYATHVQWRRRQTYVALAFSLFTEKVISPIRFEEYMLEHVLKMGTDSVPNIRLVVSRCLSKAVLLDPYFNNSENPQYAKIVEVLRELQMDKDRDVREQAICEVLPPLEGTFQHDEEFFEQFFDNGPKETSGNEIKDDKNTSDTQSMESSDDEVFSLIAENEIKDESSENIKLVEDDRRKEVEEVVKDTNLKTDCAQDDENKAA